MTQSPYSFSADRYLEQGLSVMPCGPGTKFPGTYSAADGWRTAWDWQKYCDRLPTGFETSIWEKWPDAGVCLALGASSVPARLGDLQLVAIDIDTEEPEEVAAILSTLPGSPVRKRGAKGETAFYLAPKSVPNRPYNNTLGGGKRRMLDLLGHGRQTVMPPSVHPDCPHCGARGKVTGADMSCGECGATGQAYRWTTLDTLETFDVADLPVLPADVADRLSAALAVFGHVDAPTVGEAGSAELDGELTVHRALNEAALANLAAWVPALQLYKCRQVGGKYKAVAGWRPSSSGRPLSKRATNLAIGPEGIKDCGEGRGYTPIDLVMAACGADLDSAFRWLQDRVSPQKPVILSARVVEQEFDEPFVRTSPPGNLAGLRLAAVDGERVEAPTCAEIAPVETPAAVTIIPVDACTPPGMIGELVEWMNETAARPLPQLNLGAAVAFLGAVMGRRWEGPTRARSNFYVVGVAPTGRGKGHPLTAIGMFADAAGVGGYLGPEAIKSESAIRKMLEAAPTVCCLIDEMGGLMRKVLSKRASSHEAGIRDIMLTLFSKANETYRGSEGASEKAVPITNPNLCLYGTSTPEDLWSQFSSGQADDGFLPRWLVFDAGEERVRAREPRFDVSEPLPSLRKRLHEILDVRPAGNLNGVTNNKPIKATWGAGADSAFAALQDAMDDRGEAARKAGRFTEQKVATRYAEHVIKLALIYAVGIDARKPVITIAALEWARTVVEASSNALIAAIEGKVADNDAQAQYLWTLDTIRRAGADGILESALVKMVRGRWDQRRHGDILGQLQAAGEIWRGVRVSGAGRPGARVGAIGEAEREAG